MIDHERTSMLGESGNRPRSILQVAMGFLLGGLVSAGCSLLTVLVGAALGLRSVWMFPFLNAIALVASGRVALRKHDQSTYPEGVLIALSVAFVINGTLFASILSGTVD